MDASLRLRLLFQDRLGIVADVAAAMARNRYNILSMEVEKQGDRAVVFAEATGGDPGAESGRLTEQLRSLPGLLEISAVPILPRELRERRLQVVLDSIGDGILAVDADGAVAVVNRVAREVLGLGPEAVGRDLRTLGLADTSILGCLAGRSYLNAERSVVTDRGRIRFLATGKPVVSPSGHVLGAVETLRDTQEIRELASAVSASPHTTFDDLVGRSPSFRQAISLARRIARTDAVVSIVGESGTGKELFAAAIHAESGRRGPFLPLNCAAVPEALLESELFGYEGGAFSGARREGKPGLFELAEGGTVFLDEIGEMSLGLQAKMLRVIQEGRVRRVGGAKEVPVDARILAATNRNLEEMVRHREFRQDLFYRISVFPLHLPALRERPEDIPLLARHFLFLVNSRLNKRVQSLTDEALEKLCRHDWPGNVRELRNVIERAAILCAEDRIGEECILFGFGAGRGAQQAGTSASPGATPLPERLGRLERTILAEALASAPSKRQAAKLLGISHTPLLNKLEKHEIEVGCIRVLSG